MDRGFKQLLDSTQVKLADLRRWWKLMQAGKNMFTAMGVFSAGAVVLALMEAALWLPPGWRTFLGAVLVLSSAVFLFLALSFLLKIKFQPDYPSDEEIALWVGEKYPAISDRLRNAVQLQKKAGATETGESGALREEALRQAAPEFLAADMSGVVDSSRIKRRGWFFTVAAAGFLLLLIPPVREGFWRAAHCRTAFIKPPEFTITIDPGNIQAIKGDTLEIKASISGGRVKEVEFCWVNPANGKDTRKSIFVPVNRDSLALWKIEGVTQSFEYWAQAGREKSGRFTVTVEQPPAVKVLQVELIPPSYTKFPPLKLDDNLGDLLVLPGTQARFKVTADAELSQAMLCWNGAEAKDTVFFHVEVNQAEGRRRIEEAGSYQIRLKDIPGLWNQYPIEYRVEILPDLPPVVEITKPGIDLEITGVTSLPLIAEAEDDFGISRMVLFFNRTSTFEIDTLKEFSAIPLKYRQVAEGVYRAESWLELAGLELMAGDVVEYYVEVWDNDAVSGPKFGKSSTYILRLPTMAEMFREMDQAENQGLEELKQTLEQSKEVKHEVEKAIEEMKKKGDLDWTEKRELEENIKQQKEVLEKLEAAKEALEEIMQKAEESSLMSLELAQKYSELQKLMSEIADPEFQKAMQKLQEALQQADPEQLRQAAEMFQMTQEEMLKQIEKTLEIFKQLQLERQMEELSERAAEMAERQDDIADSLANMAYNDTEDLQRQEQQLKSEMEDLLDRIEETAELAEERDSTAAGELRDIAEEGNDLPSEMQETGQQMKSGDKQKAEKQGRQISQKLSKMSQQIKQSQQSMTARKKDELSDLLLQSVRDLVTLSQLQEELKEESASLSVQSPRFREQASSQAGIKQGLEGVTDQIFELSQQTFFVTPQIGQALGQAAGMMEAAISNYTNRNPREVFSQQSQAQQWMDRAAVEILDAISKMQGSASSTGYAELMEQLQKMAGQQAGLNSETQSMMMPMPGEGGSGMSMEQMAQMGRMAAEQRGLQRAMEEAAQAAEQMGGVMGDLGQAAKDMGEAADSLEDRNVGERTLKLQERILSRLLDAQKSVRTQKTSKERQSKTGEDLTRRSPKDIPEDTLEEMMRRDILQAMQEGYSSDYQKLIRDYYKAVYQRTENR